MNALKRIESEPIQQWSVGDLEIMADRVAKSRLFGLDAAQAFTLMLLCQAEGIHPVRAVQRYRVIQGHPAMKTDAMLADFQRIGGTVKWLTENDDREKCEAIFTHPRFTPEGKTIRFGLNDAKAAGLTGNPAWQKYPANMLRARVISTAIRMLAPGIVAGLYTPEEVTDFEPTVVVAMPPESTENAKHHAKNYDNQTGHGSGAYAAPDRVQAYQQWIDKTCEEVNTKWLDYLTDKNTGEISGKAPAEIVNFWQLSGHLLKFARASGMVAAPDEPRGAQRDKFATIAWDRFHEAIEEEAMKYCRQQWRIARAKHKANNAIVQVREPDADDEPFEDEVIDQIAQVREPGADDEPSEDEVFDQIAQSEAENGTI
jgi:hypothetical protein